MGKYRVCPKQTNPLFQLSATITSCIFWRVTGLVVFASQSSLFLCLKGYKLTFSIRLFTNPPITQFLIYLDNTNSYIYNHFNSFFVFCFLLGTTNICFSHNLSNCIVIFYQFVVMSMASSLTSWSYLKLGDHQVILGISSLETT